MSAKTEFGRDYGETKEREEREDQNQAFTRVVVSTFDPPILASCSSVISVVKFMEKYVFYRNWGGTVRLLHCLAAPVMTRLARKLKEKTLPEYTDDELASGLLEAYAPSGSLEFIGLLESVRCFPKVQPVDVDNTMVYVSFLPRLCKSLLIRRSEFPKMKL